MVQYARSNGYAICKVLGSTPTYDHWSFSPVIRFLHSNNRIRTLTSVPCGPIIQPGKQASRIKTLIIFIIVLYVIRIFASYLLAHQYLQQPLISSPQMFYQVVLASAKQFRKRHHFAFMDANSNTIKSVFHHKPFKQSTVSIFEKFNIKEIKIK